MNQIYLMTQTYSSTHGNANSTDAANNFIWLCKRLPYNDQHTFPSSDKNNVIEQLRVLCVYNSCKLNKTQVLAD